MGNLAVFCVNKRFQLGVFSEFHRGYRILQLTDIQSRLVKQAITEHHLIVLIIWHREVSAPLLVEHLLDATTYGIYNVKVNHSPAQTFITEMRLRSFVSQCVFQSARNECACIEIIQVARILHEVDALLKFIILMGYAVMKSFTNGVVVISPMPQNSYDKSRQFHTASTYANQKVLFSQIFHRSVPSVTRYRIKIHVHRCQSHHAFIVTESFPVAES